MSSNIKHLAIIMDGNGRWAQKKSWPRLKGHEQGAKTTKEVVKWTKNRGISYLTVYAFSSENWKRPETEVSGLFNLLGRFIDKDLLELKKNNVRLNVIGDITKLPNMLQKKINKGIEETSHNNGLVLSIALNYGGREEILRAVNAIRKETTGPDAITEETFNSYLYTNNIPDPDLLIRTGGEKRISNFLLWQIAYTEIYFSDVLWPDFDEKALDEAITWFANRQRRFGMTSEQIKEIEEK
jgi:undecaprenyl diphosphate synthase